MGVYEHIKNHAPAKVINVENDQEYFLSRTGNYHYCSLFELFLN